MQKLGADVDRVLGLLSRKQIISVARSDGAVNIWDGAIRSGKTVSSLLRWLIFVASAPLGGELVVVGRTRESIARNVFGPLSDPSLFGVASNFVSYTVGAPTGQVLGRTVHVVGASDSKAEKTIRGMTVAGAYVDEITVIPEEFFTQLLGRMSVEGAKLFGTTNPDSPSHWLKKKFLDKVSSGELPHWRYFRFAMEDNPRLSPEYIAQRKAEYTGLWYRRFVLGEWVAAEGAVFPMWDPSRHVVSWDDLPPMERLLATGVDYGTTNPTAAVVLGLGFDRKLYFVDEWRYDPGGSGGSRLTDGQLSQRFREWLEGPHVPHADEVRVERVVVDPSAASFRLQLYEDGLVTAPAYNDVLHGVSVMATLFAEGQLLVADRCRGLIGEIPGYAWDERATEQGLDRPLKVADHSVDAARYAVVSTESLWRPVLRAGELVS